MNIQCTHLKDDKNITKSLQGKKIFKDQCVRCFHQPTCQDGLFICMKCFNGFCPTHRDQHTTDHTHSVFTNITMRLKNQDQKFQITKLAIGKQGGAVGGDEYQTTHTIYCNQCKCVVEDGMKVLEAQVQSLINTDSPFKKQSIASWEVEVLPCEHSLMLEQIPVNKDLSKCSNCELSTNLWLCLTCGNTGCGRKHYDGTGGNNHGIKHFQQTGHPLVVKLGTITAQGQASLYCYACNNDVKDQFLKSHMQLLGIDFGSQKKTQKTIAQMNLDINLNFMLSKQLQNEKNDKIMFGKDYTGMNNIGNSCYLNSIVQMMNSIPQVNEKYFQHGSSHTNKCKLIPSQCFYCQISKVFIGLNNGQYSQKQIRTRIINQKQVTEQYQSAISPYDFKLLIAQNNSQFRSNKQQDAEEYLQWLLQRLDKEQVKFDKNSTNRLFEYQQNNRLVCQQCQNYKLVKEKTNLWKFPVPPPTQGEIDKFYQNIENLTDEDMKKAKACQQPEYDVKFQDCINYLRAGDSVTAKCSKCNKNCQFISRNYFKSTPKYLLAMANRFVLQNWVPKKLNALIEIPQKLDLSEFLLKNAQKVKGEQISEEKKKEYSEDNLAMLEGMGYSRNASVRALTNTKDNIEAALNWLMDNMDNDLINAPLQQQPKPTHQLNQQSILQIQQMGFDDLQSRIALIQNKGDVANAIEWLFNCGGDITAFLDCLEVKQEKEQKVQKEDEKCSSDYRLKAVVVHLGKSVHSGHYVVYIKKDGNWTLFNDEKVTIPEKALIGKGYLYVYEQL